MRVQAPHRGLVPREKRGGGVFFAAAPADALVDNGLWGEPVDDPPPIVEGFLDQPLSEPEAAPALSEPEAKAESEPVAAPPRRRARRGFLGPPTGEFPRRPLPPAPPASEPVEAELAAALALAPSAAPAPAAPEPDLPPPAPSPAPAERAVALAPPEPEPEQQGLVPAAPAAERRQPAPAWARTDAAVPWWREPPPVPAPPAEAEEADEPLAAMPAEAPDVAPVPEPATSSSFEAVLSATPAAAEPERRRARWADLAGSIRARLPDQLPAIPMPAIPWRPVAIAAAGVVVVVSLGVVGLRLFGHHARAPFGEPVVAAASAPPAAAPAPASAPAAEPSKSPIPDDPAARAQFYLARAKAGDPDSELQLAILYAKGEGVTQDYGQAATWFRAAASEGVARAQYDIGVLSERGRGVPVNYDDAFKWYSKAAEANFALAQYNLAVAYTRGQGTRQDFVAAAGWYQRAAAQGVVPAMVNLAILYERGEGVTASAIEAYAWYRAAGERGNHPAAQRAAELFDVLSIADRARAETRTATILAQLPAPEPSATLKSGLEPDSVVPASTAAKPAAPAH